MKKAASLWLVVMFSFGMIQFARAKSPLDPRGVELDAIPGEYLLRLKPSAVKVPRSVLELNLGARILREYPQFNFLIVKKPSIQTQSSVVIELMGNELVSLVEPNYIYRTTRMPNDPEFHQLWGLQNIGQAIGKEKVIGKAGIDIAASKAWSLSTDANEVVVAVIDTGVDLTHADLRDNLWINSIEQNGLPNIDDDNNGVIDDIHGANFTAGTLATGNANDDQGHGSHCAGTIAGRGDNGDGVVGVCWTAQIMAVKFLDSTGAGTLENAIRAVDYAVTNGAKVLSNSWSGGGFSQLLKEAIERADAQGAIFIAAASNSGQDSDQFPAYPASYNLPNVISVAAINSAGRLADFSNYGLRTVHIAAPGENIYSLNKNGGYIFLSGTSMATPHVSGAAALIWQKFPTLTHHEVRRRIVNGARPLAGLRRRAMTGGLLNIYYSMTEEQPPEDVDDPFHWNKTAYAFSSPHPYSPKERLEHEIEIPGATEISIFFDRFELENFFDTLQIMDRSGRVLMKLSGTMNQEFSPIIPGNYAKLVFVTDATIEKYGFDISAIAHR